MGGCAHAVRARAVRRFQIWRCDCGSVSGVERRSVLPDAQAGEGTVVLGGVVDLEREIRIAFFTTNGDEIVGLPPRHGEVLARVDVPARSVFERHLHAAWGHGLDEVTAADGGVALR